MSREREVSENPFDTFPGDMASHVVVNQMEFDEIHRLILLTKYTCMGRIRAPRFVPPPSWTDRAQHFRIVIALDLCVCTKFCRGRLRFARVIRTTKVVTIID